MGIPERTITVNVEIRNIIVWQDLNIDVDKLLQKGPKWRHCVNER